MSSRKLNLILLLWLAFGSYCHALAFGEPEIKISSLFDRSNLSLNEVVTTPEEKWRALENSTHKLSAFDPNYWHASNNTTLWLKVELPRRIRDDYIWLQFLPNVGLDGQLAQNKGGNWYWHSPVDRQSTEENSFPANYLTFKLKANGAFKTTYIKLETSQIFHFSIDVLTKDELLWGTLKLNLFNGLVLGVLLLAIIYNLAIGVSANEKMYLFYAFYVFCIGIYLFVVSGYPRLISPEWGSHGSLSNLTVLLAMLSATLFVQEFLQTKKYVPKIDKTLSVQTPVLFFGMILVTFASSGIGYFIAEFLGLICPLILLLSGILAYKNNHPLAKYFLLAWTLFIFCAAVWSWMWLGLIEPKHWVLSVLKVGILLEITLLSLVLAYQYSSLKRQTETLIKDKTRYQQLSETDELTGVLNRRGFLNYAKDLLATGKKDIIWLSIDISHFKRFNDLFGHHSGDRLLAEFGALLTTRERREDLAAKLIDTKAKSSYRHGVAGRIGGEEFAIIINDCTIPQARLYAERLIREFEKIEILQTVNGDSGSTLCIGGAFLSKGESIESIWRRADGYLQECKELPHLQVNIR